MVLIVFGGAFAGLVLLTVSGTIAPWTGRFYSLWDTGYAKIHIPIIASVSEHQPTAVTGLIEPFLSTTRWITTNKLHLT
jgi:dolichyl-diphosphooligosaccharide--protein glycosyltransferase